MKKWKSLEVKTRKAMGLSGIFFESSLCLLFDRLFLMFLSLIDPLMIVGIWEMSEGKSTSGNLILGIVFVGPTKLNYSIVSESGMDFESDWENHRKSLAFTAQEIRFATSFMPWSCRIPISEGFYEFL